MTKQLLPQTLPRRLAALLVGLLAAGALAGCGAASTQTSGGGGGGGGGGTTSQVLHIPYQADMGPPDPDVFYGIEGNTLIQSVYEGLVQYAPNSNRIAPQLATSWTISPDRLTYTFVLRPNVRFQDGTALTSASWVASIERRKHVNQASVYMVAPIASMQTPSPTRLVVHLRTPVAAFMDYLASTYGPKAIGPQAIVTHAGKDFGQTWLRAHGDGSGPYALASFQTSQQYVLQRNPHYWGPAPRAQKVIISVIPSANTQYEQLQQGDQAAILHSFPISELPSARANPALQVLSYPSNLMEVLYADPNRAPFSSVAARQALAQALNIPALVAQDLGGTGTVATGAYPKAILSGQPALGYHYDPAAARAVFAKAKRRSVSLGYVANSSGVDFNLAQTIQSQLSAVGLHVSIVQVQVAQTYAFGSNPAGATDLLLGDQTPDAAHPDTWARINWGAKGGLNYYLWKNPTVNSLLDKALAQPSPADEATYRQIGQIVTKQAPMVFLADLQDVIVARKSLGTPTHVTGYPWALTLSDLAPGK